MSNYNRRNSGNNVMTGIAIILCLLLIASVTLGLGAHFGGWFDKDDTEATESVDELDSAAESTSEIEVTDSSTAE